MFGTFGGPLPEGKYVLRYSNLALHVPSILNNTVVTLLAYEERNELQSVCHNKSDPQQNTQLTYLLR